MGDAIRPHLFDAADGTAALPSYTFLNDRDTGFYRAAANQLGVALGGAAKLLYSAGVFAFQEATTISSTGQLTITGTGAVVVNDAAADVDFRIESDNNSSLFIVDAALDNFGIGRTVVAPSFITILGTSMGAGASRSLASGYGFDMWFSSGSFTLANADPTTLQQVYRVFVDTCTLVGANPNQTYVSVAGFAADTPEASTNVTFTKSAAIRALGGIQITNTATGTIPSLNARGCLFELSGISQALTTASATQAIGTIASFGIVTLTNSAATLTYTNTATVYIAGEPVASTNVAFTNPAYAFWVDAGVSRFDGDIGLTGSRVPMIYTTSQTTTNAETVDSWGMTKQHITPYDDALAVLRGISVVAYEHKTAFDPSGRRKLGVLAESVAERMVTPFDEYVGLGQGPRLDMLGLAAINTRAIQQVDGEVEALRARVAFLEGRLQFLEVSHATNPD